MQGNGLFNEINLRGHTDSVTDAAHAYKHGSVVSVSLDRTIKIWSINKECELASIRNSKTHMTTVKLDSGEENIFTGGMDFKVYVFDYETFKSKISFTNGGAVTCLAVNKDGNLILCVTDINCDLSLWDMRSKIRVYNIPRIHDKTPTACLFTPDDRTIITTSTDGTAKCTDHRSRRILVTLKDHKNAVSSAAVGRNGKLLATSSWDKTVLLYDIGTGTYRKSGPQILEGGHNGLISCCDLDEEGTSMVTGGYDNCIILWDTETKQIKSCLKVDFKNFAQIKLWKNKFQRHSNWINSVFLSKNRKWILSASKDRTIKLWDLDTIEGRPYNYVIQKDKVSSTVKCLNCEKNFIQTADNQWKGRPKCAFCGLEPETSL